MVRENACKTLAFLWLQKPIQKSMLIHQATLPKISCDDSIDFSGARVMMRAETWERF